MNRTRFCLHSLLLALAVGWTATLAAETEHVPFTGLQPTAYTLGKGGLMVGSGYVRFEGQLPRGNQPAISDVLNVGGVSMTRNVGYFSDAGLIPITLGFGMGETSDVYLHATLSNGRSEKRVSNFYGVPDSETLGAEERYSRFYDQPLFDMGLSLKYQLKPDLGDGLPAVATLVGGRYGYTADEHEEYQDTTPEDGFPDFGGNVVLLVTQKMGPYLAVHGQLGFLVSKKTGRSLAYGGAGEFELIPDRMIVFGDFANRRLIAGNEYSKIKDNLNVGIRYRLSETTSAQVTAAYGGHLYLSLTRSGETAETIAPQAPSLDNGLF